MVAYRKSDSWVGEMQCMRRREKEVRKSVLTMVSYAYERQHIFAQLLFNVAFGFLSMCVLFHTGGTSSKDRKVLTQ